MSVSGSRAAVEINLDEFERRLRAAGTQPADLNDPLLELARLVESSKRAAGAPAPVRASAQKSSPAEDLMLRPAFDQDDTGAEAALDEAPDAYDSQDGGAAWARPPSSRRSGRWMITVS